MNKDEYLEIVNNLNQSNISSLLLNYANDNNKTLSIENINEFNKVGLLNDALSIVMNYYDNKFAITSLETNGGLMKW